VSYIIVIIGIASVSLAIKGYGRLIMEAVERRIKEKGCPRINLQARSTNKGVIEFYQAIGYTDDNVVGLGKRLEEDEPYNG
jgi:GNAT superfamily N-acetyltransferase